MRRSTPRENRIGGALLIPIGIAVAAGGGPATWSCGYHALSMIECVTGVMLALAGLGLVCRPGRTGTSRRPPA